jgi:hypothetical protein
MTNKHDFAGKSIKCDTWEQMQHLAKLAKLQGAKKHTRFSPDYFSFGNKCFVLEDGVYDCCVRQEDNIEILYSDFIPPLPAEVVEVTGCVDCKLSSWNHSRTGVYCGLQYTDEMHPTKLFTTCPLKKASITIKLKHNDTSIMHTNIVC